jgi:hypothetical protein
LRSIHRPQCGPLAASRLSCISYLFAQIWTIGRPHAQRRIISDLSKSAKKWHKFEQPERRILALIPLSRLNSLKEKNLMKNMEDRIVSMEQQLKTLRERHSKAEAQRKKDEARQVKIDDTRRKLLAGSVVLDLVQRGELDEAQLKKWLSKTLSEPADRALFSL